MNKLNAFLLSFAAFPVILVVAAVLAVYASFAGARLTFNTYLAWSETNGKR